MHTSESGRAFQAAPLAYVDVGTAEIAYRTFGRGAPVLLIHGWPLSGFTWRHLVPRLAAHYTCIVADSPGAGDTRWKPDHDFKFRGQAEAYALLLDRLGLDRLSIIAHDTGATIARELALIVGERVEKLVMINTEIPHHRPPWIETYQRLTRLPGAAASLRLMLRSRAYRRSTLGFGGCFYDPALLDGEFHDAFIQPLIDSRERLTGQIKYLRGIDWSLVDGLETRHREIKAQVAMVWGEDDPTFPITRAIEMVSQFERCLGVRTIPHAKLFVHEEKPDAVVDHALELLDR